MNRILTIILSLAIFSLLLAGFLHPITAYTQDLGRHLLMGRIMLETWSVPDINLLSYTYPDFPFINHHYLSGIIYYLLQRALGDTSLLLASVTLVFLACSCVFIFALKKASLIPTAFLAIIYLRILFERTDIRPEQFGYLLFAIFLITLFKFRKSPLHVIARSNDEAPSRSEKYSWGAIFSQRRLPRSLQELAKTFKKMSDLSIYVLVPLSFLWVQLHISFALGLFLIGLFLVDSLWTSYKQKDFSKAKKLSIVLFASCLITILNPNRLAGALYPLRIFQNYGYTIQENQTIFFLDDVAPTPSIFYFKIAVLILFTLLLLRFKHTRAIDWLLAISFTILGASAIRNFPFFALATFIPASLYLSQTYSLSISQIKHLKLSSYLPLLITCCLLLITYHQIKTVSTQKPFGIGVAKGAERGVDFFEKNQLRGPIFNNFDIGSYLAYRLYPQEKVFIDGRPEAYPAEFIQQTYIPVQEDPLLFEKVNRQYGFNSIFFSHTDQTPWANAFLANILKHPEWKVVYLDETSIILVKNTAQNKAITSEFGMETNKLIPSHIDENDFMSLLKLASFFNKTGLTEQEVPYDEKLLQIKPAYCPALYSLALYHNQKQNSIPATAYQQQFLTFCQ